MLDLTWACTCNSHSVLSSSTWLDGDLVRIPAALLSLGRGMFIVPRLHSYTFCSQHLDENAFTVHSIDTNYAHSLWILPGIRLYHALFGIQHPTVLCLIAGYHQCQYHVRVVLILSLLRARALSSLVAQSLSYFLVF